MQCNGARVLSRLGLSVEAKVRSRFLLCHVLGHIQINVLMSYTGVRPMS